MQSNSTRSGIRPTGAAPGKLRLLISPLVVTVFLLALTPAAAFAAKTHKLITEFSRGESGDQFGSTRGLGVDESSGNLFVATQAVDGQGYWVYVTGPEGEEPSGVAKPFKIAVSSGHPQSQLGSATVDNSPTSPSKGALYVSDTENHVVKKFTLNPLSEEYELSGTLAVANPLSVAVDTKGNVFVVDEDSKSIAKFNPAGTEIGQIPIGFPTRAVAVDGKGNLYVQEDHHSETDLSKVIEFPANPSGEIEPGVQPIEIASGSGTSNSQPTGIAANQSSNEIYVVFIDHVEQFESNGGRVGEFDLEKTRAEGIAVNGQTGLVYTLGALTTLSTPGVTVFGPTVIAPDSTTGDVSDLEPTSATLNGAVSAAGGLPATCEFEYATDASFEAEGFEGAATAACAPAGPFAGSSVEPVSAAISGLAAQTIYHYRLVASSANGTIRGETLRFFTPGPPVVNAESVGALTGITATLEALVNPAAKETSNVFEYVSEADFEASGYANAVTLPLGGEAIGSGFEDVAVSQSIAGLTPSTNYLFRVTASNPLGVTHGPDRFFTTLGPNGFELPDGRVFEQVSPVDKNGAAATGRANVIQSAPDGDGITYISRGGIPGAEGAQKYPTYLASRGADWSTQGLLPPASAGSSAAVLGWSEDLSRAYVSQGDPGTVASFLERDSASRSLQSIAGEGSDIGTFRYVGASSTGSVVFFESDTVLYPGGAAKAPNLYAWDRASGELSLAGALNNAHAPAKGTLAGSNEPSFKEHFHQAQNTVSSDGARVFFTDLSSGQLYLRQNPTQPQSALDGDGKCTEAALACTVQVSASQRAVPDPIGKKPAVFWGATADGSKSFFTSSSKLTDDATTGPGDVGSDLYRYDADTGVLTDLTPDITDANGAEVRGVLGTSDDGSYVYFAANGVLAAGATPGNCSALDYNSAGAGLCNLYLAHDGATVFVAPLSQEGPAQGSDAGNWFYTVSQGAAVFVKTSRVSADGQTLLFRSQLSLTGYDNKTNSKSCGAGLGRACPEFYRYSAADGELGCVSCNPSGAAPGATAPALQSIDTAGETPPNPAKILTRNLSADGNRVFFETADKLVASDTNGDDGCPGVAGLLLSTKTCQDVYEWEAEGTGSCHSARQNGGCLYLISSGTSSDAAYFADADMEGNNAFFFTEQSLAGQDKDQIVDLYDARVGGGIVSQNPPPPPPVCEGEACKGPAPTQPATESPGSASFTAPGNPKPSRQAKKKRQHKKKKHGKRHPAKTAKRNG